MRNTGQPTLQFPPMETWIRNLLLGVVGLFVAEQLLFRSWPEMYRVLALWPQSSGFQWHQPITRWFLQQSALSVIVGVVVLYFALPALWAQLSRNLLINGVIAAGLGATLIPIGVDGLLTLAGWPLLDPTPIFGPSTLVMALFVLLGLALPNQTVHLFFVLPIQSRWFVWMALGIPGVLFVLHPSYSLLDPLGGWMGLMGWWWQWGPPRRRRDLKRKAQSIEQELARLQVIEGGRSDAPQGGQGPDDWVH